MSASPAQVANDLDAQAAYFAKSEADIARACRDAARMIRQFQRGEPVDGRTYYGLHKRLSDLDYRFRARPDTQIAKSIGRGLTTLEAVRKAGTQA